jgi:sirohydrochlorin ferrochelatase
MMRYLLLVAHGSRRAASNEEVRKLAAALVSRARGRFDAVGCAFLEIAEPSIPDGIEAAVGAGAGEVVVLPYFLSAGRHVAEDIPREVEVKQVEHPDVRIRVAPYLGLGAGMADILLGLADSPP